MPVTKEISLEEVKKHNKPNDLWVIIFDKVYDLTQFRTQHPGGAAILENVSGRDATKEFFSKGPIHGIKARKIMSKYQIGELAVEDRTQRLPYRKLGIAFSAVLIGIAAVYIVKRAQASKS